MTSSGKFKDLYELQSGGYPLQQVLLIEMEDDGEKHPVVVAFFPDAEMDVFVVQFDSDGLITFDTEDMSYITTDADQLAAIAALVPEAIALNEELYKVYDPDTDIASYQHLLTKPRQV